MEEKILGLLSKVLGKSIRFDEVSKTGIYGLYTYKNRVYILRDGLDIPFKDLEEFEQLELVEIISSKKWVIDNTLQ